MKCFTSGNKQANKQTKQRTCQFRRHKEMQVQFQGQENPLEDCMATHSSILAGESLGQKSYSP